MIDRETFCNLMKNELGLSSEISEQFLKFLDDAGLVIIPIHPDESLLAPSAKMMDMGESIGAWKIHTMGRVNPFVFHYALITEFQRNLFEIKNSVFNAKKKEKV